MGVRAHLSGRVRVLLRFDILVLQFLSSTHRRERFGIHLFLAPNMAVYFVPSLVLAHSGARVLGTLGLRDYVFSLSNAFVMIIFSSPFYWIWVVAQIVRCSYYHLLLNFFPQYNCSLSYE